MFPSIQTPSSSHLISVSADVTMDTLRPSLLSAFRLFTKPSWSVLKPVYHATNVLAPLACAQLSLTDHDLANSPNALHGCALGRSNRQLYTATDATHLRVSRVHKDSSCARPTPRSPRIGSDILVSTNRLFFLFPLKVAQCLDTVGHLDTIYIRHADHKYLLPYVRLKTPRVSSSGSGSR